MTLDVALSAVIGVATCDNDFKLSKDPSSDMGVKVGRKSIRATISVNVGFTGPRAGGFERGVEPETALAARSLLSPNPSDFGAACGLSTFTSEARATVAR